MRVLISGGNSFIGKHLIQTLEEKGDEVFILPRHDLYIAPQALTEVIFNVRPDYIYLLHSYGNHYQQKDITQTVMANYFATYNVLTATRLLNFKRLVYVSTSSVLQDTQTFYSATKGGAERLCMAFKSEGKPISIVRPFSVYGPGEADFRFIPTVFRSCLTGEEMQLDPHPVHDWVYVKDFVDGLIDISNREGTFNVRSGQLTTNAEILGYVQKITDKRAKFKVSKGLRNYDTRKWRSGDPKEAYLIMHSLEDNLYKTYEYYKTKYEV